MKTKLIPFDADKVKNGAKVVTRNGLPVKILDYPIKNEDNPILGLVLIEGKEFPKLFTKNGNHYSDCTESHLDLFIEEVEVEEDDSDYNPYEEVAKSIIDMVERCSPNNVGSLQDFYDNVKAKCREAIEYDKKRCKKQDEKPKFNVGDWIVQDNVGIYKVTEICESWYEVIDPDGSNYSISFDQESMCHLWTIQDAKPGDILFHSDTASNGIFIFKEIAQDEEVKCYCDYDSEDGFCLGRNHICCRADAKILHPATKEQSALLFQKIKESRYEWDSYRMELKLIENEGVAKIEFNSKFKIGDKVTLISNKSIGTIIYISDNGLCRVRFPDLSMYWFTEDMLEPYEMIEDDDKVEEDVEPRLMTNLELSDWLRKCPEERREFKYKGCNCVFAAYEYIEENANRPVEDKLIRRNHGEWQEPLIDIK